MSINYGSNGHIEHVVTESWLHGPIGKLERTVFLFLALHDL